MKPKDLIVYLRETWKYDLDPDEHNYTGYIVLEELMFLNDPRLPHDIIKSGADESFGIRCFYIMWNDGGTQGCAYPTFAWHRADYIEKWYEIA